jgi:hypothetical protein
VIVGDYVDSSTVTHGFLLKGKTYTTLDVPGATRFGRSIRLMAGIRMVLCCSEQMATSTERRPKGAHREAFPATVALFLKLRLPASTPCSTSSVLLGPGRMGPTPTAVSHKAPTATSMERRIMVAPDPGGYLDGVAFKITPTGKFTVLYNFCSHALRRPGQSDGQVSATARIKMKPASLPPTRFP